MSILGGNIYWHASAWQVLGALLATAAILGWLSWRAFHADPGRALAQISPQLRNQALFLFDRSAGVRALNRLAAELLAAGEPAPDELLGALTSAVDSARVVQREDWPGAGRTLLAVPMGDSSSVPTAALGIVVDDTLTPAVSAATGGGHWINIGPAVRLHASRPAGLVLRAAGEWEDVALTPVEDVLLRHLLRYRGEVRSAEELFAVAWPDDPADSFGLRPEQSDRLRRLIFQLRQRLEPDPGQPRHLRTARGIGYALYGDEGAGQ